MISSTVDIIELPNLAIAFIPVAVVLVILYRWSLGGGFATYALARMLLQLLAIGYVLTYIFRAEHAAIVVGVLAAMLAAASWIALRPLQEKTPRLYGKALGSIFVGGIMTLLLVTQGVLQIKPWFAPQQMIPLAGMIFATSMNAISIAAERYQSEMMGGAIYEKARQIGLRTALIPLVNSLLAVGLVSLPGMMTGQILSGVSPLIAARYQIVVMCMIFGASGISSACFLMLLKPEVAETDVPASDD